MLVTLALVVLCAAIAGLFAHEFSDLFKRILAKPGMLLLIPLVLASSLVAVFSYQLWITLMWCRGALAFIEENLMQLIPFTMGAEKIAHVLVLMICMAIPASFARWMKKKYVVSDAYMIIQRLAFYGWVTVVILMTSVDI